MRATWIHFSKAQLLIALAACGLAAPACVSVNIGPKGNQKANDVEFKEPSAPYDELDKTAADSAWQNKNNGNTISYYSSCKDPADAPIDAVMRDLFSELRELRTIQTGNVIYNGREGQDTEVEGRLDGVPTRIRAVVFKKNDCTYTISYIGVPKSFEEDRARFNEFLGNFRAP